MRYIAATLEPHADELTAVLGEDWAICVPTPKNRARYSNCVTRASYEDAKCEAIGNWYASRWSAALHRTIPRPRHVTG